MTRDEHITRAMLLGMEYVEHVRAYRRTSPSTMKPSEYFDADTMQRLSAKETLLRIGGAFNPEAVCKATS